MLHRRLGVWVIQCEGFSAGNVQAIEDDHWMMQDWREDVEMPLHDAEEQMVAVRHHFESWRHTRDLLAFRFCVALPYITRTEWEGRGFEMPSRGTLLFRQELGPVRIKAVLEQVARGRPQTELTDEQWEWVVGVLGGQVPGPPPRPVPTHTPPDSPVRVIRDVEKRLKGLDQEQQKGAFQIPDGPQRLRGLAGTGKTVLLAKRAAKIHARHPDWRVAFVFFTRSLYEQVRGLVESFYREMTGESPDGQKLEILHAWGGKRKGFYSTQAEACGVRPLTVDQARRKTGSGNPDVLFEYICGELEKASSRVPPLYDAVLVDEGQDLPPAFYRLVLRSLKEPKRLYWAYDEAQGVGSLLVPRPSLVFGERDGKPLVDLSGKYEGGIEKSHVFRRCYRTPELLLMAAHAVNMGLLRKGGALQGLTTREDWSHLGYEVEGNFLKAGEPVRLRRDPDARRHPLDVDEGLRRRAGPLLVLETFVDESAERQWIAEQVAHDIREKGLRPTDLLVTAIIGDDEKQYFDGLEACLRGHGLRCWRPGRERGSDDFHREGHVTLAKIFEAKGNEAWKVYAARFHYATKPIAWRGEEELHKRNQAFVALTRARIWCVVTGLGSPVFEELRQAVAQAPELVFPAFNRHSLKRRTDEFLNGEVAGYPVAILVGDREP